MSRALPLLACILIAAAVWALWPAADPAPVLVEQADRPTETRDEAAPNEPGSAEMTAPDLAAEAAPPADGSDSVRTAANDGFQVEISIAPAPALEGLQARLIYGDEDAVLGDPRFLSLGLRYGKPKQVPDDGVVRFSSAYRPEFAALHWRVEVGIAAEDGDEFRGSTPLYVLGVSEPFQVIEGTPARLPTVRAEGIIELQVPMHDWHLLPDEDTMLQGEFDHRPGVWQGKPTAWVHAEDGPRVTKRLRVSPLHLGQRFRVVARPGSASNGEPSTGEWFVLTPGVHQLEILRPVAAGMLEIFFPESRALFPESEQGLGWGHQVQVRLQRFDANTRSSFTHNVLIDPTTRKDAYDPSWGLVQEPSGAWQGDTYVARIGWIEAGPWQISVDARHAQQSARPTAIEVAPFDVTRVTLAWMGKNQVVKVVPSPPGESMDEYVISTWATLDQGAVHRFAQQLIEQQTPRELTVPPASSKVVSVSYWNAHRDGRDLSRLLYYRGHLSELDAENQLRIRRLNTRFELEFPLDSNLKGSYLAELQANEGQLDGQAIPFAISVHRSVSLIGFPPGFYRVRLAPQSREQSETRFLPWRTIEIKSQPNQPNPGSAGSGN